MSFWREVRINQTNTVTFRRLRFPATKHVFRENAMLSWLVCVGVRTGETVLRPSVIILLILSRVKQTAWNFWVEAEAFRGIHLAISFLNEVRTREE